MKLKELSDVQARGTAEPHSDPPLSCTTAGRRGQRTLISGQSSVTAAFLTQIRRSIRGMGHPFFELLRSLSHGEIPTALQLWPALQRPIPDAREDEEKTVVVQHAALREMLSEFIAEINSDIDKRLDATIATIHEIASNALEQSSASTQTAAHVHDHDQPSEDSVGVVSVIALQALQTNISDVLSEVEDIVLQRRSATAEGQCHDEDEQCLAAAVHDQVHALRDVSHAVATAVGRTQNDDGSPLADFEPMKVIETACLALGSSARSAGVEVYGSVSQEMPASVRGDEGAFRRITYLLLYSVLRYAEPASLTLNLEVDRIEDDYLFIKLSLHHPKLACSADTLRKIVAAVSNERALDGLSSLSEDGSIALLWVAQQVALHQGSRLHVNTEPNGGITMNLRFRWRITPTEDSERRISSRFRLEMVKSNHGPVIDLSRSGARIRSNQRLHGEFDLNIQDAETEVQVPCRVCWVKQQGWRRYDIGLQFLDVTADITQRITSITMRNRWARTISET